MLVKLSVILFIESSYYVLQLDHVLKYHSPTSDIPFGVLTTYTAYGRFLCCSSGWLNVVYIAGNRDLRCVSILLIFYYSSKNRKFTVSPVNGWEFGPGYS